MKKQPRPNCIICEREIQRASRGSIKTNRGNRAVTCSSKCSKIYTRVHTYIRHLIRAKIKKEKKNARK